MSLFYINITPHKQQNEHVEQQQAFAQRNKLLAKSLRSLVFFMDFELGRWKLGDRQKFLFLFFYYFRKKKKKEKEKRK